MARSALATQQVTRAGITLAFSAANVDGHYVDNDGEVLLYVKNGAGAPITVTLPTPITEDGFAVTDYTLTVANGSEKIAGPFDPNTFNNQSGADSGRLYVDFSAVTSITVAAIHP